MIKHIKRLEREEEVRELTQRLTINPSLEIYCDRKLCGDMVQDCFTEPDIYYRRELEYNFQDKLIFEGIFRSHTNNEKFRFEDLIYLLRNEDRSEINQCKYFILMIRTSKDYPLTYEELNHIPEIFNILSTSANFSWDMGQDEYLDKEASLLLVGYTEKQ